MRRLLAIFPLLMLTACGGGTIAPGHFDMDLSRRGGGYEVVGRYGPGWSEGDVRGEVEQACHGKSLRLVRYQSKAYVDGRGTAFEARCASLS